MSIEAGVRGSEDDDLALPGPLVDAAELADYELVEDMHEAQGMQARMYAWDLETVARWAARRRTGIVLGTADGLGGPENGTLRPQPAAGTT